MKKILISTIYIFCILFSFNAEGMAKGKVINVSNATEFMNALGSDRTIVLSAGNSIYNITEAIREKNAKKELQLFKDTYDIKSLAGLKGVGYTEVHDGEELVFLGIKNLTIKGGGKEHVHLQIEPRYAYVINFIECSNIRLENIKAGHTDEGYCSGGVFNFENCENIDIRKCDMYGCGTEGITAQSTTNLHCTESAIHDCTYSIMTLNNCSDVVFDKCKFNKNREYGLVNVNASSKNIQFLESRFWDNDGTLFVLEAPIIMKNCVIKHPEESIGSSEQIKESKCFWNEEPPIPITYHYWDGKIDGKNASLAYAQQDRTLIGELMTKEDGNTVFRKVLGMVDSDGEILFKVFDANLICTTTQSFSAKENGNTLDCFDESSQTTFNLKKHNGEIRYAMNREADAYCSPFSKSEIRYFKADNRELAGGYSHESLTNENGRINISRSGDNLEIMIFNIDCNKAGRQALIDGKSTLENNTFKYHLQYGECNYEFEVVFYNGFLIIRRISGKSKGCFAPNAGIEGIYVQEPAVG